MNGYLLPLRCPACAGLLEHVNAGKVHAGSSCSAVAKCTACKQEWSVHVQLRQMQRQGRVA